MRYLILIIILLTMVSCDPAWAAKKKVPPRHKDQKINRKYPATKPPFIVWLFTEYQPKEKR